MVKSRKNSLNLKLSNDVDLEYKAATTTSRRTKKGKGKTLTKTRKMSLKAKPKKSSAFLVVNGKKIPLKSSKKSGRNKMSSQTNGAQKASSAIKKRAVSSKFAKKMVLKKKSSQKASKKTNNVSSASALLKKRNASSKTNQGKVLPKKARGGPSSSKLLIEIRKYYGFGKDKVPIAAIPAELLANYFDAVKRETQDVIDKAEATIVDAEEFMDEASEMSDEGKKEAMITAEAVIFGA